MLIKRILPTMWLCLWMGIAMGASSSDAVELKRIRYSEWQQKLKSYKPDIVVVDLWATWCVACIERFPKMVELHSRYQQRGVRFVSLCLDEHEDQPAIERAQRFLQQSGAVFENYLIDENLMQAFEMLDVIGIPAVLIYGRKGKERFRLTGDNPNKQFTDQDIERAILHLLQSGN